MATIGCINGTLDNANYSSPIPAIGVYIATASLFCMLFIVYDIIAGYRAKESWLPCKLFTLNSVTLALLSIAAKIPVDLTTAMPSPQDQLSKLSGTAFLCISIGFLWPSVGVNTSSESVTNMAALSIFIITIVVNTYIQILTGVIALFVSQHIVITCFMLVLLILMWFSAWDIGKRKRISIDHNKGLFMKGNNSMNEKLRDSYLFGFESNPQLVLCLNSIYVSVGIICTVCCGLLIHASVESFIPKRLEFCSGASDYDWSIPGILVTQISTAVVGSIAIVFRWISLCQLADLSDVGVVYKGGADEVIEKNPVLGRISRFDILRTTFQTVYLNIVRIVSALINIGPSLVLSCCVGFFYDIGEVDWEWWRYTKSSDDYKKWMAKIRSEPPNNLLQLLSRTPRSHPSQVSVRASFLSVALLVRIAQVSLPDNLSEALVKSFVEAMETVHFIDQTINPKSLENDNRLLFAKAVWAGDDFSCLLPKILENYTDNQHQSELDRALSIITKLKNILPSDSVWDEVGTIVDIITRKTYSSIEDLKSSMEQLFVDMLCILLAEFPNAIFKFLSESLAEEYHERVKLALKYLGNVGPLEAQIQWSFPPGCDISGLI